MFPVALEAAIENGDEASLSENLRENGFVRVWEEKKAAGVTFPKHVSWNAADVIAEEAFNRYYMRGICRRAIEGTCGVEVYRAKASASPAPELEEYLPSVVEPGPLLSELRGHPDPHKPVLPSGMSVRLPRSPLPSA